MFKITNNTYSTLTCALKHDIISSCWHFSCFSTVHDFNMYSLSISTLWNKLEILFELTAYSSNNENHPDNLKVTL